MSWLENDDIAMPEPSELAELRNRVQVLEAKIDGYLGRMEDCLEHDRQFQLGVIWNIVYAANFIIAIWAVHNGSISLNLGDGWLVGVFQGVAVLALTVGLNMWAGKGHEGDKKRLSKLPEWKSFKPWVWDSF